LGENRRDPSDLSFNLDKEGGVGVGRFSGECLMSVQNGHHSLWGQLGLMHFCQDKTSFSVEMTIPAFLDIHPLYIILRIITVDEGAEYPKMPILDTHRLYNKLRLVGWTRHAFLVLDASFCE
jgi:hypothetical protein